MKKIFLWLLFLGMYHLSAHSTVVVVNEFVFKELSGARLTNLDLSYDETRLEFLIAPASGIEVDENNVPMPGIYNPPDTMGWTPLTRTASATPFSGIIDQFHYTYGFEYVDFTDTGGQLESLTCLFEPYSVATFKPNKTPADIRGDVTIRYYSIRNDGVNKTKMLRSWSFYYTQHAQFKVTGDLKSNFIVHTVTREVDREGKRSDSLSDITYYDGMARPVQYISVGASATGKDIITPVFYDAFGHSDCKSYLPYAGTNASGEKRQQVLWEQSQFYNSSYPGNSYYYTEQVYENSPLSRVVKSFRPGKLVREKNCSVKIRYGLNMLRDIFMLSMDEANNLKVQGIWEPGSLKQTLRTDEDNHTVISCEDAWGRVLLQRVGMEDGIFLDTYYVYDDLGHLCWVVTPEGSSALQPGTTVRLTDDLAGNYCYCYRYDTYGNQVFKKLPGREPEYYIYDIAGRLVLHQDGVMRNHGKWLLIRYDVFSRPVEEKLISWNATEIVGRTWITSEELAALYSVAGLQLAFYEYDRYIGNDLPLYNPISGGFLQGEVDGRVRGLKTSEKFAVLRDMEDTSPLYVKRKFYYDDHYRVIQIVEKNHLGNMSHYSYNYDWAGNIISEEESHTVDRQLTTNVVRRNIFDRRNRLVRQAISVNGTECAAFNYSYDELGRKNLATYGIAKGFTMYSYGLENELTQLLSTSFTMNLRYASPSKATPLYSGNISEWEWQRGNLSQLYALEYDNAGRLTEARHYENGALTDRFTEKALTYDRNGNLQTLQRTSGGDMVDNLVYKYQGNLLTALTDTSGVATFATSSRYRYDANGNMTEDGGNRLDFEYNILNLLYRVNGESAVYLYSYDGRKLSCHDKRDIGRDYLGSCVYTNEGGLYRLESVTFAEGMITGDLTAHYFLRDHLGSVRVVLNGNTGTVEEEDDYYPFGTAHRNSSLIQLAANRFKYNGKEEQPLIGSNYLDYGARIYNPALGRWLTADPKAESYYNLSSYVYCSNNPLMFVDPDGEMIDNYQLMLNGKIELLEKTDNQFDVLYASNSDKIGDIDKTSFIQLNDKSVLPTLEKRNNWVNSFAITTNKEDAFNIFHFSVMNSDVEWGIDGYKINGDKSYLLRTSHNSKIVNGVYRKQEFDMFFTIHSHPYEAGASGFGKDSYTGDMATILTRYYNFTAKGKQLPRHYIFTKKNHILYNYNIYNPKIYIRKINTTSDLFKGLNF